MKSIKYVLAAFLLSSVSQASNNTTYVSVFGPTQVAAPLIGNVNKSASFAAPQITNEALITIKNGNGVDLSPTTCTGNILAKLACQLNNALKLATVELTRPKDLVLTLNNQVVVNKSAYKPAVGEINLVVPLKLQNNIQVSFKGVLGANISIQVKAPGSAPQNQLPIASFQLSHTQGFAPLTITANALASSDPDGSIASYDWEFSDGAIASGPLVSHVIMSAGSFTVKLTVTDNVGGKSSKTAQVNVLQNQLPIARLKVASNSEGYAPLMVLFEGNQSSDPEGQVLRYFWNFGDGSAVIESDASISHEFKNAGNYSVVLIVQDSLGSQASASATITVTNPVIPIDPVTVAPDLSNNPMPTFEDRIGFLYKGENPIQKNVDVEKIDPKRVSVLKGRTFDQDGVALSGVTVRLLNTAEMGETISRADGGYDFAFNSGANVVVSFEKNGYAKTQRQVDTKIQDYFSVEDVHMVKLDEKVTQVSMNSSEVQIAEGSKQQDADGERTGVLFFPPQTQAELVMPDGSRKAVSNLNIRVTEYTVGENGKKRMPASLPSQTAYTYAMELSSDEAIALGADSIQFNKSVPYYVDNFLNIPVGKSVPVGVYDFKSGSWKSQKDGVVIRILGVNSQNLADIDLGKNRAATSDELSVAEFSSSELQALASKYQAGTSLWRITTKHFSTFDLNYGRLPSYFNIVNNVRNHADMEKSDTDRNIDACPQIGCIIDLESRNLREEFNVPGTDIRLMYSSEIAAGRTGSREIKGHLLRSEVSEKLTRIDVNIDVAGLMIKQFYTPQPNLQFNFQWDGKDAYGRYINGPVTAKVSVAYFSKENYSITDWTGENITFDVLNSAPTSIMVPGRDETSLVKRFYIKVSPEHRVANQLLANGWLISDVHNYNPVSQTLTYGNGKVTKLSQLPKVYKTIAGSNGSGFSGDDGPAITAKLNSPMGIVRAADGSLLIADKGNHRIRKIDTEGIITTVAGNGILGYSGDEGLAVDAQLNGPEGVAVDKDGNIFIADTGNNMIRKVGTNGRITTIAGVDHNYNNTANAFSSDRDPLNTYIEEPNNIICADDGSLYISSRRQILRILPTNRIMAISGFSFGTYFGENILAAYATFTRPRLTAIGSSGELFVTDEDAHRIRVIDSAGVIRTVIGSGNGGFNGEFRLPELTDLAKPNFVSVAPSGEIYFTDSVNGDVRYLDLNGYVNPLLGYQDDTPAQGVEYLIGSNVKFKQLSAVLYNFDNSFTIVDAGNSKIGSFQSPLPNLVNNRYMIPSEDASEMFVFDQNGRHLQTLFGKTGRVKKSFEYDSASNLIAITDAFQNRTQLIRNGNSTVSQIVDPYGKVTALTADSNGMLTSIRIPTGETTEIGYSKGLMTYYKKPKGNISYYEYDSSGFLKKETNPQGGTQLLTQISNFVTRLTTGLGKTITVTEQTDFDGYEKTTTLPSGLEQYNTIYGAYAYSENSDKSKSGLSKTFDPRTRGLGMYADSQYSETPSGKLAERYVERTYNYGSGYYDFNRQETIYDSGASFTLRYSSNNKQEDITSFVGRTAQKRHDDWERVISYQVGSRMPSTVEYDQRGRVARLSQGDRVNEFTYDSSGNLNSITDAIGRTISMNYDLSGRIVSKTSTSGKVTYFAYDANSNVNAIKPPDRDWHQLVFGMFDFMSSYKSPNSGEIRQIQYSYTDDRGIKSMTYPNGKVISFNYEPISRRLASIQSQGEYINKSYDSGNGNTKSISSNDGVNINFENDAFLVTKRNYTGIVDAEIAFEYNYGFNLKSMRIGDQNISYAYDDDRLLIQVGNLSLGRNTLDGLVLLSQLGDISQDYSYNSFGEIISVKSNVGASDFYQESYQVDKLGRIATKTEVFGNTSQSFNYYYDLDGRIEHVSQNGQTLRTYQYDSQGNRLNNNSQYDSEDRLLSNTGNQYTYNANGELTSKLNLQTGINTVYTYTAFGQLRSVTSPNKTIEYLTDGENHRVARVENGTVQKKYIYDQSGRLVAELDSANHLKSVFIYATQSHSPDAMTYNGVDYKFIKDQLGSIKFVVNASNGSILQSITYDEFGLVLSDSNPGAQPFGFAGGIYDHDTGLVRFGARDYDASTGRWTTKDPILFSGGDTNLYAYVGNDPLNWIDPTGLKIKFRNRSAEALFKKTYEAAVGPARNTMDKLINDELFEVSVGVMCDLDLQNKGKMLELPEEVNGLTTGNKTHAVVDISDISQNPKTMIHELGHAAQLRDGMTGNLPEAIPDFLESFVGGK